MPFSSVVKREAFGPRSHHTTSSLCFAFTVIKTEERRPERWLHVSAGHIQVKCNKVIWILHLMKRLRLMRELSKWSGRPPSVGVERGHKSDCEQVSLLASRNKRHFPTLICAHTSRGGERYSGPPPKSRSHAVLQPAPFNKSLGEISSISRVPQTQNTPPEFQQCNVHTRVGEISVFLSLSRQFFTRNQSGLLQVSSPNDTQGYAVFLLSFAKDVSFLISARGNTPRVHSTGKNFSNFCKLLFPAIHVLTALKKGAGDFKRVSINPSL